jgi:feruloyl esterase
MNKNRIGGRHPESKIHVRNTSCALAAVCSLALGSTSSAAATCESLITLQLTDTTITSAVTVPGPSFTAPNGASYSVPSFCRVSATLTPSSDSLINMELWMPTTTWNGRFEGTGNGGYAGTIALSVPAMISGLQAGFAVAGNDMGTAPSVNNDADLLVGHPEKWSDWGYRSTHLLPVVSKEIMQAFYGQAARYSYFNGCSTGGQQALVEAQRFPADYDGILGGDPASNRTHVHTAIVWNYGAMHATAQSLFTSSQTQLITNAVLAACAVASGGLASDPFLTDPRACNWDPSAMQCSSPLATNCLNADQVEAARAIYNGPRDPFTGHLIFPGSVKGSESDGQFGWVGIESQAEPPFDSLFKWVFGSTWLWETFDFDQDMASVDSLLDPILNANSADLSQFKARAGKLLMYHGWADPLISPQDSIDYYLRVVAAQGNNGSAAWKETQSFYRLFMVPGMYHCAFGPGPNAFGNLFSGQVYAAPPPVNDASHDAFVALQQWVENGIAPTRLIATKYVDDVPNWASRCSDRSALFRRCRAIRASETPTTRRASSASLTTTATIRCRRWSICNRRIGADSFALADSSIELGVVTEDVVVIERQPSI